MIKNIHSGKLRNMASVYLRRGEKLLLLYRQGTSIVSDLWIGSAGGHFEKDDLNQSKACVLRELYEELSLEEKALDNLTLRYITLRYTDGEVRQNYYFFADLSGKVPDSLFSNEGITQWFDLQSLSSLPMPVTARHMIDHYIDTGQYDDALYVGISNQHQTTFLKL